MCDGVMEYDMFLSVTIGPRLIDVMRGGMWEQEHVVMLLAPGQNQSK